MHRKVVATFASTKQENISINSYKNKFDIPDLEAITFWETELTRLKQTLTKISENNIA